LADELGIIRKEGVAVVVAWPTSKDMLSIHRYIQKMYKLLRENSGKQ